MSSEKWLSDDTLQAIRESKGKRSAKDTSKLFRVSLATVYRVWSKASEDSQIVENLK